MRTCRVRHFNITEPDFANAIKWVDEVIPEESWDQKTKYVGKYDIDLFVMGDDWIGKFDHLKMLCQVEYLPRTEGVSSTMLKKEICLKNKK